MTTKTAPRTAAALVAEAKGRVENLDPATFAEQAARTDTVVIDLREAEELTATGRIPGAVHIPRGMLEFRCDPSSPYHDDRLRPSTRTLLYCASGGRSALAADLLASFGYGDVAHLDGGFNGWTAAGQPVESATS